MDYKLYTTVNITHTGQYRAEDGKESARWQEQNFNTVLQTIGIRANITYRNKPFMTEVAGHVVGLETEEIIKVWRFDFSTEHDYLLGGEDDPVEFLKDDFELVPFISGLGESMVQNYNVFVTRGPARNIVFYKKQ